MINYPKISIVTPSYNQGEYLEETILSVINQNYPNLEYVIIDGGSTDNSVEIIKKYQKHLKYWVSEKDNGQSNAINKGFKKLTGDVFNWLNSDDYLEEGALFKIGEEFKKDKKLDVLAFNFYQVDENSIILNVHKGTQLLNPIEKSIGYVRPLIQPATFFKMEKIRKVFPIKESLHYSMDFEMWTRFIINFPNFSFKNLDEPIVNFRTHPTSKTEQNLTSNSPSDLTNKFSQEIHSILWNLTKDPQLKKKLKLLMQKPVEINYNKNLINNTTTKKIVNYYFRYISENLYASNKKNDIVISNKILIILSLKKLNLKFLPKAIKSFFPSILTYIRNK